MHPTTPEAPRRQPRRGGQNVDLLTIVWLCLVCLRLFTGAPTAVATEVPRAFVYPVDVAVSADGTVYVADLKLPGIWRVTAESAQPVVIGERRFSRPLNAVRCVAVDATGQLYAGDSATREIYRVSADGELQALTGGQIGIPAGLIAVDDHLFVADLESQTLVRLRQDGQDLSRWRIGDGIRDVAAGADGAIWAISTRSPQRVWRFEWEDATQPPARTMRTISDPEASFPGLKFPAGLAVQGESVFIVDSDAPAVWEFEQSATQLAQPRRLSGAGSAAEVPWQRPVAIAIHKQSRFVIDSTGRSLWHVDQAGTVTRWPGSVPATATR